VVVDAQLGLGIGVGAGAGDQNEAMRAGREAGRVVFGLIKVEAVVDLLVVHDLCQKWAGLGDGRGMWFGRRHGRQILLVKRIGPVRFRHFVFGLLIGFLVFIVLQSALVLHGQLVHALQQDRHAVVVLLTKGEDDFRLRPSWFGMDCGRQQCRIELTFELSVSSLVRLYSLPFDSLLRVRCLLCVFDWLCLVALADPPTRFLSRTHAFCTVSQPSTRLLQTRLLTAFCA
jgi:hypothetical protein